MAKSYLIPVLLLFCASCFEHASLMTYSDFNGIEVGTPVTTVEAEKGKPYAIHSKKDGTQEYEYIERIDSGNNVVSENHYFFIVRDGKVMGKYMNKEKPPAYDLIYQVDPNYPSYSNPGP